MAEYIDREALIESVKSKHICVTPYTSAANAVQTQGRLFREAVDEALTADVVEVRHGFWGLETDEEEPLPMFKLVVCSVCNKKANNTYNYCPECGAKMDRLRREKE